MTACRHWRPNLVGLRVAAMATFANAAFAAKAGYNDNPYCVSGR